MNGYELVRLQPNQVLKTGDTITGNLTATGNAKFVGSLQGNAATATKLQAAKTINGTPFNGSQNITTTRWGEGRTITIGKSGKPVNGGADVTWTLTEIGAATDNHTHGQFTRTANGFVPQPGGSSTTRYLREDGTWVVPPGLTSISATTNVTGFTNGHYLYNNNGKVGAKAITAATIGAIPTTGGNATGNINFTNDNTGITFFDGGKIYKKYGAGLRIVPHSDVRGVVISNASDTSDVLTVGASQLLYNGVNVVSRGSNANGHWVRLYDGTQKCWGTHIYSRNPVDFNTLTMGPAVYGGRGITITYPQNFVSGTVDVNASASTNGYCNCMVASLGANSFVARTWTNYPTTATHLYIDWTATGRWK